MVNTNGSRVTRGKPSAAVRASASVVRSRGTHRHRPRLFVARGVFEVRVRVPGRHLRDHGPSPRGSFRRFRRHGRARTWVRVVRRELLSTFEGFRLRVRRVAVGSGAREYEISAGKLGAFCPQPNLTRRIRLFACANQVRKCQVISNLGFAKSGNREKYLVFSATWQIGFGPKRDWLSYALCQRGSLIRSMWRRFVIGGNRKKLNFSRTPIRRVRAILIDNSIVATHCSARLITSIPFSLSAIPAWRDRG